MKKFFYLLGLVSFVLSVNAMEWKCNDGTGSKIVQDSSPLRKHLTIMHPDKVSWAREDFKGFFLNYNGGLVSRFADKDILFPDGMKIDVRFSVDKKKTQKDWLPLITLGDFMVSYCVWVHRNGHLFISLPGTKNWYRLNKKVMIEDMKEYHLQIVRGNGKVQVALNGKIIDQYASTGKVKSVSNKTRFYLGSTKQWQYHGNIYYCSIKPFDGKFLNIAVPKEDTSIDDEVRKKYTVADPAGTVIVDDFSKFSPKPEITKGIAKEKWSFRSTAKFFKQARGCLHPAGTFSAPEISYAPNLKGKYDVYVGVRVMPKTYNLYMRFGNDKKIYHLLSKPTKKVHESIECRLAADVDMTGKKIIIMPQGDFMLGYIKFIPSANRRKTDYPAYSIISVDNKAPVDNSAAELKKKIDSGYFKERVYRSVNKSVAPAPASKKRGYLLFNHDYTELLFPADIPARDGGNITLKTAAAQGEYEPVTFGVRPLKDNIGRFTLKQKTPFKNGITAEIAVTDYASKRTTNYVGRSEFMHGPICLAETASFNGKKDFTNQYWITVKVPENTAPGVYKSEFILENANGNTLIPFEVTVYPFKLAPAKQRFGFWNSFPISRYWESAIRAQLKHGMNTFIISDHETVIFKKDRTIDFENSVLFKLAPIIKKQCPDATIVLITTELRPQPEALYRKNIFAIEEYVRKNNLPEIVYHGVDEALSYTQYMNEFIREVNMLHKLKVTNTQNHIWYKTPRNFQKEVDMVADKINIFNLRFNTRKLFYIDDWETIEKRAAANNQKLWAYNSNNAVVFAQPAMMRFAAGWFFLSLGKGTQGQTYWTFEMRRGSAYSDLDGTDWHYIYPAEGEHKGGPAIDLVAFREGIDDIRYITTLQNAIKTARAAKKDVSSAEAVLKKIADSVDVERFKKNSVFFDSKFDRQWTENGKRYASGSFNIPTGWKTADYEKNRRAIAAEIIKLQQK